MKKPVWLGEKKPRFARWLRSGMAFLGLAGAGLFAAASAPMDDSLPLRMPAVGDYQLRLISSNLLELALITTKQPDPAPVTQWNFVDANGNLMPPRPSQFTVTANGQPVAVQAVGFKRRVLYAPVGTYDLRIANYLYLRLTSPMAAGSALQVRNPDATLWGANVLFTLTVDPLRYSPAVHVNQAGYGPAFPKKAIVGYFPGSFGELAVPNAAGFQLVSTATSNTVFSGSLARRPDVGFTYSPTPYQQVYEADFSSFQTPGQYKLVVPGLGASLPFLIDEGVAAALARAYELGIYHQRCGARNALPFTRFVHEACHTNLAQVPDATANFAFANFILNQESVVAANNPLETAPRMTNVAASLYPFVRTGPVEVSGGHHDAGDYSKYTINSALLIHYLTFAADAFPGVGRLDNLGIPESGDGISDLLQEAKWEADFLVKMQDTDGGFYFNLYPRNRQYEVDVLPDHGDPQIVLPKNTAATAAAVGALAEIGSSPTFKAIYPAVAANYLAQAVKGWMFLTNAFNRFGRNGSCQSMSTLGNDFMHNDELAWAAAALYAATGNSVYDNDLRTYTPNPNDPNLRKWGWWSLFLGYGCAYRDYAFAARTGRLQASQLNAAYLARCEAEIRTAATNVFQWSADNAYGASFTGPSKPLLLAGFYFSSEQAFDAVVAHQLNPQADCSPANPLACLSTNLEVVLRNLNYELGCNPVNITFVTGLGSKRQRDIVHQYAQNDDRVLPPSGIPLGNIQQGFGNLAIYQATLGSLSYPSDSATVAPYPIYDRWGDSWNVLTEFVVSQQSGRAVATAAWLMAMTSLSNQVWKSADARITGLPAVIPMGQSVTGNLVVSGLNLSQPMIVWEALGQEPRLGGTSFSFTPGNLGDHWVEVEAQWPDGRRVFAATNFFVTPGANPPPLATNADMVALYRLSTDFSDAIRRQPGIVPNGNAALDPIGLHVEGTNDYVSVYLPNRDIYSTNTQAISVEARVFINHWRTTLGQAWPLELVQTLNTELALYQDTYAPAPGFYGGPNLLLSAAVLTNVLTPGQWHLLNLAITKNGYVVTVDGNQIFTNTSGDLANWAGSGQVYLRAGDFNGWIQNLVVRNVRAPSISGATALANGAFQLSFSGSAGISYTIWAATNLVSPIYWSALGSPTQTLVPGTFQFTDGATSNNPMRYYRIRIP